jgi:hypothetical protein
MRKLLTILFLVGFSNLYSQNLIQTFVDRCTGAVNVFTVPMNGQATIVFYNKSRTFTSQQFQNGELRAWLEETYAWWSALSPCSTTTTGATATQQTTQQTTQQATQAATNATSAVPPTPPSTPPATGETTAPPPSGTTNTSTNDTSTQNTTGSTSTSGSADTSSSSSGTDTSSSGSGEGTTSNDSGGTTEGGSSDGGSTETETKTEETKTEETKTEETKSEEKTEEVKEESKEESKDEKSDEGKEEDSEEKSDEEKSDEEESEDKEEEDSKEEKDNEDEEEDGKNKKKKRNLAPPVVMANTLLQQMPTGEYNSAAMFGISQTSLLGTETYGLNLMVYDNLQQFMLNGSYSKVFFTNTNISELNHDSHKHYSTTKEVTTNDPKERPQPRVNRVYSGSVGAMKMFTTYMGMMNHSMVWLGTKGSATGLAFGTSITSLDVEKPKDTKYVDNLLLSTSLTGFWTKSFPYSPRLTLAPMVAVSSPFMSVSINGQNKFNWNTDLMIIGGSNFNYTLTQRFGLSLGITLVESTIKDFPTMKTFMIGGRLSF